MSFKSTRLPMTVPKGCEMDCMRLAFSADLVSLSDKLSSEISCMVRKSSEPISSSAMSEATVTSVKKELTTRIREQMAWLMMIQVLRLP